MKKVYEMLLSHPKTVLLLLVNN